MVKHTYVSYIYTKPDMYQFPNVALDTIALSSEINQVVLQLNRDITHVSSLKEVEALIVEKYNYASVNIISFFTVENDMET